MSGMKESRGQDSFSIDSSFLLDDNCPHDGLCGLEAPPDVILTMPPPPIPFFMKGFMNETFTRGLMSEGGHNCHFCHIFASDEASSSVDPSLFYPPEGDINKHEESVGSPHPSPGSDSVVSVVAASILGLTFAALVVILVWYKKFKTSNPSLPPSLPSSSEGEYTCPVVNGKSTQSIIINDRGTIAYSNKPLAPSSFTSSTNPWRRGTDFTIDYAHRGLIPGSSVLHHTEEDHYAMRESCTSSPVYAELQEGNNISPYAVGMGGAGSGDNRVETDYYPRHHHQTSTHHRRGAPYYYCTTQRAQF